MAKTRRPADDRDDGGAEHERERENSVATTTTTTTTDTGRTPLDGKWMTTSRRRGAKIAICLVTTTTTLLAVVQFRTFAVISPEWRVEYRYINGGEGEGDGNAPFSSSLLGSGLDDAVTTTTTAVRDDDADQQPPPPSSLSVADDDSSASLDVDLTYLPWELDSIMSLNRTTLNASSGGPKDKDIIGGRCVPPPPSLNKMCCLGSSSAGGATSFKRNAFCAVGDEAYEKVRVAAMRELNRGGSLQLLPLPTSSSNPAGEGEEEGEGEGRPPTSTPRTTCDVCRILDLSLRHNWTMGFTGDSVHHQVWDGFLCELSRSGYTYVSEVVKPDQGDNNRWRYGVKSIETVSIEVPVTPASEDDEFASGDTVSNGTASAALAATTATVTARYYAQYRPLEDMSELANIASETDVLVFNFGVHWLRNVEDNYERTMRDVLSTFLRRRGDNATTTAAEAGKGFAVLATRETSAQHFANPGGEFSQGVQRAGKGCVEMDDDDGVFGWRERIVNRVADELGYGVIRSDADTLSSRLAELSASASAPGEHEGVETVRAGEVPPSGGSLSANATVPKGLLRRLLLRRGRRRLVDVNSTRSDAATTNGTMMTGTKLPPPERREDPIDAHDGRDELLVLPFLNFTRGLRDLHKIGISGDCTHFCSSPFLWSPLWRSLRLGMDYREERLRLQLRRPARQ